MLLTARPWEKRLLGISMDAWSQPQHSHPPRAGASILRDPPRAGTWHREAPGPFLSVTEVFFSPFPSFFLLSPVLLLLPGMCLPLPGLPPCFPPSPSGIQLCGIGVGAFQGPGASRGALQRGQHPPKIPAELQSSSAPVRVKEN